MSKNYTPEELEALANQLLADDNDDILDRSDGETIACKVGRKEKEAFRRLCENKLGCTMNDALQMCIDVLRRYMEDRYNLSKELQQIIELFEGFEHWGKASARKINGRFNLAEPIDRALVLSAIYILGSKHMSGRRMVLVDGSFGQLRTETFNAQNILEEFMCNYDSRLYREIRSVGVKMGCSSIDEILRRLVSEYTQEESEDDKTIRMMFEDNRKDEFGHEMADAPYRRKMGGDMESWEAKEAAFNARQTALDFGWTEEDQINETF